MVVDMNLVGSGVCTYSSMAYWAWRELEHILFLFLACPGPYLRSQTLTVYVCPKHSFSLDVFFCPSSYFSQRCRNSSDNFLFKSKISGKFKILLRSTILPMLTNSSPSRNLHRSRSFRRIANVHRSWNFRGGRNFHRSRNFDLSRNIRQSSISIFFAIVFKGSKGFHTIWKRSKVF